MGKTPALNQWNVLEVCCLLCTHFSNVLCANRNLLLEKYSKQVVRGKSLYSDTHFVAQQ